MESAYEPATLEAIAQKAKQFRVNSVIVEPNFGDGMFNRLLEPVMTRILPCLIEETERSSGQKEKRIVDTLEPVMNMQRMVIDRSIIGRDYQSTIGLPIEQQNRYRLFYQMTRITRDKGAIAKDDRIDALALAVHYWTENMARDSERAVEQSRADALHRELTSFMDNVMHRPVGGDSVYRRSV